MPNHRARQTVDLAPFRDYFVINGRFCNVDDAFFRSFEDRLASENLTFRPRWSIPNGDVSKATVRTPGKRVNLAEMKARLCSAVLSEAVSSEIPVEFQSYEYSPAEIEAFHSFVPVGEYSIKKYYKTPKESVLNSQILIDRISYESIPSGDRVSLLGQLMKDGGKGLHQSNILQDGNIVQGIGGGSCLAATIVFRTLLRSGIAIEAQKSHNIYYENIYGPSEIGLDATIYEDESYYVDLAFRNNYGSPIVFVPKYTDGSIQLTAYASRAEFVGSLERESFSGSLVGWNYRILSAMPESSGSVVLEREFRAKYEKVDSF